MVCHVFYRTKTGALHESSLFHGSLACALDWGLTTSSSSLTLKHVEKTASHSVNFLLCSTSPPLASPPHSLQFCTTCLAFPQLPFPSCLAVDYETQVKSSSQTKGCCSGLSYSFVMVMQGGTGELYMVPALQNTDRLLLQMNNELSK